MEITREDILHVAKLARLKLTEQELDSMNMEKIIDFANMLSNLETSDIKPTNHVLDVCNVLREDEIKPSYDREDILKNAPAKERGCFAVPKVVE